jgi:ABC-type enterochelin transport system permease subunit
MKNVNLATILGVLIIIIGILPFVIPNRIDPVEAEELKSEISNIFSGAQELIASLIKVKEIFGKNEVPVA